MTTDQVVMKAEQAPALHVVQEDALALQLRGMTVDEIHDQVDAWLLDVCEQHDNIDVYAYAKQMEEAVTYILDEVRESAFESAGRKTGGEVKGKTMTTEALGHTVQLIWADKWIYSEEVQRLVEQQKRELKALQAAEQANGKARQEQQKGVLKVTLAKGTK